MHVATNLSEFFDAIRTVAMKWEGDSNEYYDPWFRGQTNEAHPLVPSLYRYDDDIDEDDFRDEFNFKAFPYLQQMRAGDPWESYALMQHYGLPTRLLDWSEAALVALYFASSGDTQSTSAAVWMLDPWTLNDITLKTPWILDPSYEQASGYLAAVFESRDNLPQGPAAIQVPYNSPRISAQRGLFTIHGRNRIPLEQVMASNPDRCVKIVIPGKNLIAIRRELYMAGVGESMLFPELGAMCRDLKRHWILDRDDAAEPVATYVKPKTSRGKNRKVKR